MLAEAQRWKYIEKPGGYEDASPLCVGSQLFGLNTWQLECCCVWGEASLTREHLKNILFTVLELRPLNFSGFTKCRFAHLPGRLDLVEEMSHWISIRCQQQYWANLCEGKFMCEGMGGNHYWVSVIVCPMQRHVSHLAHWLSIVARDYWPGSVTMLWWDSTSEFKVVNPVDKKKKWLSQFEMKGKEPMVTK